MKALTFRGVETVRHETVPDPRIEDPGDVIVRVDGSDHWVDVIDGAGHLELELDARPEQVELDPDGLTLIGKRVVQEG